MEEKKLTDEEIVKDIERSTGMPNYWKKIVLDLIHRLQSENEQLRNAKTIYESVDYCADDLAKALKTIDEQKAEIERLKEKSISHYRDSWKNKFFKAQEELERLTEEIEALNDVKHVDIINELSRENKELQKQVDELKSRNEKLMCDNCAYKDHIAKIDTLMKEVNERLDKVEEQAVKDTAREILTAICEVKKVAVVEKDFDRLIKWLKERYGVEVE